MNLPKPEIEIPLDFLKHWKTAWNFQLKQVNETLEGQKPNKQQLLYPRVVILCHVFLSNQACCVFFTTKPLKTNMET